MPNEKMPIGTKGRKDKHLILMTGLCLVDPWGPDWSGFSS